jgi:hypothetical protein
MARLRKAKAAFIAAVKQFPWRLVLRVLIGTAIVLFTHMPGLAALLFAGLMNYIDDLTKKYEEAYAELPEENSQADVSEYAPPTPRVVAKRRKPSRIGMALHWLWRLLAVLSLLYLLVGLYAWLIYGR